MWGNWKSVLTQDSAQQPRVASAGSVLAIICRGSGTQNELSSFRVPFHFALTKLSLGTTNAKPESNLPVVLSWECYCVESMTSRR